MTDKKSKVGFWGLTALVLNLVIGMGIYNLPQNIAAVASPVSAVMAWGATALGFIPLVLVFRWLNNRFPQYKAGLYEYARAGYGDYLGFNIAWGYWLCTAFPNVAYGIMLNDTVGVLLPSLAGHGWYTFAFVSAMIWIMFAVVSSGVRLARQLNVLLTVLKVLMIIMIIIVLVILFNTSVFSRNVLDGIGEGQGIMGQVRGCMMVTLFCFIGIEGAAMMSAKARRPSDVGKASVVGLLISLLLYVCVNLLCFGIMSDNALATLPDPSVAYLLKDTCGHWAYWCVLCAVVLSLTGGWIAWTLIVAQVPYEASRVKMLPRVFSRLNRNGMPYYGLLVSSLVMEVFLVIVLMADDVYLAALNITGMMVIPCYFFAALFMLGRAESLRGRLVAGIATIFGLWMAYCGGLLQMMMTSLFYLAGLGFYIKSQRENLPKGAPVFSRGEVRLLVFLIVCGIASVVVMLLSPTVG